MNVKIDYGEENMPCTSDTSLLIDGLEELVEFVANRNTGAQTENT